MPSQSIFLIDSNSLITPKLNYYPLDLVPSFWNSLKEKIEEGSIAILDKVKEEIISKPSKDDDLSLWLKNISIKNYINHNQKDIVVKYRQIMNELATNPCYYPQKAVKAWSDVADPWIIATAATFNYTIVTFETRVNLSSSNKCGKPKIPNLAQKFGVSVTDLFHMIRELNIKI